MTLKNTDKFIIEVKNRQVNNGDTEIITESGTGSMRIKDGRYYIMYKTDATIVMIRLEDGYAVVTRMGETRSDMEYRLGKTTKFMYNTPFGAMEMELVTHSLNYELGGTGGSINLHYDLCGIENNMIIKVKIR